MATKVFISTQMRTPSGDPLPSGAVDVHLQVQIDAPAIDDKGRTVKKPWATHKIQRLASEGKEFPLSFGERLVIALSQEARAEPVEPDASEEPSTVQIHASSPELNEGQAPSEGPEKGPIEGNS